MLQVRFLPPAAKFIKKLKDKKLKELYKTINEQIKKLHNAPMLLKS